MKLPHILFFGTHEFALHILQAITEKNLGTVPLIITRPDKPVGRKKELQAPPVKIYAEVHGIPVVQPASLRDVQLEKDLYDVGVTIQYGQLIPPHILDAPKKGVLNIHPSLLPKYRGASPIQSAILNSDTETGVSIMKLDVGLDTGPVLLQKKLAIDPNDTYQTLEQKLIPLAIDALEEALSGYMNGSLLPTPQEETQVTHCKELTREDGIIDWKKTNTEIYNQFRALTPWPGISTTCKGKNLKLLSVSPVPSESSPGLVSVKDKTIFIGCGAGTIRVDELQLEGKKPMSAKEFLNGYKEIEGQTLPSLT